MRHPFQGEFRCFRDLIHSAEASDRPSACNLWTTQAPKRSLNKRSASLARMLVPALALAVLLASGLVLGLGLAISAEADRGPGRGTGPV